MELSVRERYTNNAFVPEQIYISKYSWHLVLYFVFDYPMPKLQYNHSKWISFNFDSLRTTTQFDQKHNAIHDALDEILDMPHELIMMIHEFSNRCDIHKRRIANISWHMDQRRRHIISHTIWNRIFNH